MPSKPTRLVSAAFAASIALVIALGLSQPSEEAWAAQPAGQQSSMDDLMRQKLQHGQGLLRAVVLGEHVSVERHAYELTLLSEASTWTPLTTPQYLRYAADFRETAEQLRQEAQDRNMERVAFAYSELVTTCVQCHRHVRGAQSAN